MTFTTSLSKEPSKPSRSIGTYLWPALGIAVLVACLAGLWAIRPLFHGLFMLFYVYPLVTWIPMVIILVLAIAGAGIGKLIHGDVETGFVGGAAIGAAVGAVVWLVSIFGMAGWTGHALYEATDYQEGGALPSKTQPRLLPKSAATAYGDANNMENAHLVIDPTTKQLTWSAEKSDGIFHTGKGQGIAMQPLDRLDGTMMIAPKTVFIPSAAKIGPGSIKWNGYKKNYLTSITDRIVVPLEGGDAITIAPYIGFKGFPVRHRYLKGVYVYHTDGTMEDLTVAQALARPELANSGRIFPENLARDIAEAHGYKTGPSAVYSRRDRTKVSDPSGNPQPYLTNLGDGRVRWVTVAHPKGDENFVSAIFLTDATTGKTQVWKGQSGTQYLSNQGAANWARSLPIEWDRLIGYDQNGAPIYDWIHKVEEPRPVFANGNFYYLVSVIANQGYILTREPVEQTVVVDAAKGGILATYDHNDPEADDKLRQFFGITSAPVSPSPEGLAVATTTDGGKVEGTTPATTPTTP